MNNQSLGMRSNETLYGVKDALDQSHNANSINHTKISDVSREFRE